MDPMVRNDLAPSVRGQVALSIVLIEDEQHGYMIFLNMDPPQILDGNIKDPNEFLTIF